MQSIYQYIDVKHDYLYLKGIEKGIEEGIKMAIAKENERKCKLIVTNLLIKGLFSIEDISAIADVPIVFVLKIQRQLNAAKKLK